MLFVCLFHMLKAKNYFRTVPLVWCEKCRLRKSLMQMNNCWNCSNSLWAELMCNYIDPILETCPYMTIGRWLLKKMITSLICGMKKSCNCQSSSHPITIQLRLNYCTNHFKCSLPAHHHFRILLITYIKNAGFLQKYRFSARNRKIAIRSY